MTLLKARKQGNSICITIPALVCHRGNIKHGDVFKLERDNLFPGIYTLTKVDNDIEI